ncbi:hypothetical protein CEXT_358881 [Caerostris extrusa]|uniref:Uncharacterized protein n=1 Tax=Caerostris extrusa TaxID=172846 RepID=A0AAV4TKY5_CAEEX|nr:hypothetical protein CEXT_358881 [Caerostris extrusa]
MTHSKLNTNHLHPKSLCTKITMTDHAQVDPLDNSRNIRGGKQRNNKNLDDIDDTIHYIHPSVNKKHQLTKIEDLFPPPRAESREQKSLQPQETRHIYTVENQTCLRKKKLLKLL